MDWIAKDWDCPVSSDIQGLWMMFCSKLEQLQRILIPRKVYSELTNEFQLHGLCNASQEAYGVCLHVQSKTQGGEWQTRLLCSRTRVAPHKGSTIPRSELCGAVLLAELAKKVADSWALNIRDFWLWTDSTIILGENPADLALRGPNPGELLVSESWWNGPRWLSKSESMWIPSLVDLKEEELPEQLKKNIKVSKYLTVTHLKKAETILLKIVQDECFNKEVIALADGKEEARTSKLKNQSHRWVGNPDEPEALTPAHFLVGELLNLSSEPDRLPEVLGWLRRWKHVQCILQLFWWRLYTE
ncbi:Retrotransposon, Pao [Cinara cedri]|uniref:Retrotransposon, Pao n=1 Tax=Cinara cedri TaxID=506608 RepID=A0A5E4M8F9_9HEMI|nr:Retrotransposon, Pao [Cinara cedri]